MIGSLDMLFLATVAFVGGHFVLSSAPLRGLMLSRLGEANFRAVYSALVGAAFVWMVWAYGRAEVDIVWMPPFWLGHLVPLLMVPAVLFAVMGLTTPSPTLVGGEGLIDGQSPAVPNPGILRVTRHPFLWGSAIWAFSHLLANGDLATIILAGGILILSLGGMWHIDRKCEANLGSDWGPFAMTTSVLPFAAIISGRASMDWKGIGLWRLGLSVVVYLALVYLHPVVIGVRALPY